MAKIGQKAWVIAHAKWSVWVKNLKCQKDTENDFKTTLQLLCAENLFKKHLIVKKREHFKNGQNSSKGWAISCAKWSVWVKI